MEKNEGYTITRMGEVGSLIDRHEARPIFGANLQGNPKLANKSYD